MKIKKFFNSLFNDSSSKNPEHHHKRKAAVFWGKFIRILTIKLIVLSALVLFLLFVGVSFAQAPVHALVDQLTKPKPIISSSTILSANVQSAIQNLAGQEIKQEQANANLPTTANNSLPQASQGGVAQPLVTAVQELLTINPIDKAKIRLRIIDRQIQELETLIGNDKSDKAVDQAVNLIKTIGQETGQIVSDPKAQADREVLTTLIQQYNRLQLTIQKVEDQLPIGSYLKIDGARETYLNKGAQDSLNNAPNLEVVNNIGIKEVTKIVGSDFAELKAIEILSDLENGLKPETKVKLGGLEKELATQFEKRMLSLPPDVRNRKLQNYIKYSYGNPLNQVQSFNRMQNFLSDRDLILSVDSLKELSLKKLEGRISELDTPQLEDQFNASTLTNPQDIKILIQMKMDIDAGRDEAKKRRIAGLAQRAQEASIPIFGKDKSVLLNSFPTKDVNSDLLDVVLISEVDSVLNGSSKVSADIKQTVRDIKQKTLQNFVANISKSSFLTQSKLIYNPVPANADVRILLPAPQAISVLEGIKQELPDQDKAKIALAQRATSVILVNHLLSQVNDPEVFGKYQQFIADNPQVKQVMQNYAGQNFFTSLAQKGKIIDKQNLKVQQALYEKMQQIVQEIFLTKNTTNLEKELPTSVQQEIATLKDQLPTKNIPQLTTPAEVKLPKFASLPSNVQDALVTAAKEEIKLKQQSNLTKLDISVEAKNLGVSVPLILPDNPLYFLKNIIREIPILLTTDPVQKAEELIKIDNEKTIEAAKLIEKSQSTSSTDIAIKTLDSIKKDFDILKQNVDKVKKVEQTEPEKVDQLVTKVINDGVIRQTVISSIENNIHGDAYVAVEKIRQDILKDGVDTLLAVTDNNVQKLTDKLKNTATSNTNSAITSIAGDIKAIELLNEIARTQPQSAQKILQTGEASIATSLEKILLSQPAEIRAQEVSSYVEVATGNPVRQFEALDVIKDDFKNPQTILLAEGLKDKTAENLKERISEIPDANMQNTFADQVIGNTPQDLKAVTQIEAEIAPPKNAGVVGVLPVVQKVEDIKAAIEQNIIDTYKDKPQELAKTDFFTHNPIPDVVDVKVAQDLANALSRSSDVQPEVIAVAKQAETKIVDTFVANVSKPEFQISVSTNTSVVTEPTSVSKITTATSVSAQTNVSQLAAETLNLTPDTLAVLIKLKNEVPVSDRVKIDAAITTQVTIIENHLITQVSDPVTFQMNVAQIQENPTIAAAVSAVGGTQFTQAVEQKTKTIEQQAKSDQSQLTAAVVQTQREIFSAPVSNPSPIEQTLPQPIQQEIQQIKQEVPAQQIPAVTVATEASVSVTTTAQPVNTTPVAAPDQVAPVQSAPAAPAPQAPTVQAPAIENKPAEQPAAPAVPAAPGL